MPSGRYFFVLMVMVWGMNSVPAYAETIHVTIDQLIFSPVELIMTLLRIRRLCATSGMC